MRAPAESGYGLDGIFNEDFLTSFIAFVQNDQLHVKLGKVDWLIPKDDRNQPSNEPWRDDIDQKFRVLPSEAMTSPGMSAVSPNRVSQKIRKGEQRMAAASSARRTTSRVRATKSTARCGRLAEHKPPRADKKPPRAAAGSPKGSR